MIRTLTLLLALAGAPALANGPDFSIAGARVVGIPGFEEITARSGPRCNATGRARIDVTFTDPDGIAYAAVDLRSSQVRPAVSEQAETWLWIPNYERPERSYRWRYEDPAALRTLYTIPIALELIPGAGPIPTEVMTKDGKGGLKIRRFALVPSACR